MTGIWLFAGHVTDEVLGHVPAPLSVDLYSQPLQQLREFASFQQAGQAAEIV
jgi:hypothetical protein